MIRFFTLGTTKLATDTGDTVPPALVSQPKRLALLAYLAIAYPGSRCFRDTLLALLWPELDWDRARHALRQTLYHLRQELGPAVVLGSNQAGVGVDGERLWCDAVAFEQELAGDRLSQALSLYGGELLAGFHAGCGPAYDLWLEQVRLRLEKKAEQAAWTLTDRAAARGDIREACVWGHRVVALQPYSDRACQRLIQLLGASGQRVEALHTFDAFVDRLQREEGLTPEQGTLDLAEAVRRGEPLDRVADHRATGDSEASARTGSAPEATVAVLPFVPLAATGQEAAFADGLTEVVITALARRRGVAVVSRTSVQPYRRTDRGVPVIARELEVDFILEGSILIDADELRVTAQLIAAVPEHHLWTDSYARPCVDPISLQDELADAIADAAAQALHEHEASTGA